MKLLNTFCILPAITLVMGYSTNSSSNVTFRSNLSLSSTQSSSILTSFIQKSGDVTSTGEAHYINVNHLGLVGGIIAAVGSVLV
ncbi:unnamed protein product [Debaryomyces fabryi]|nr:unnamed protein product [Debaryomyces fabryi]